MTIREILEDVYRDGLDGALDPDDYDYTKATSQIKALMDEGEIGEILKDYSISPRGRRYLINAIKAWWEGK